MTNFSRRLCLAAWVIIASFATGCASTPVQSQKAIPVDSAVINAPFDDTWQAAKHALTAKDYTIYTRDKRGLFVAYSPQTRRFLVPYRTQITVVLERVSTTSTRVTVEAIPQRYGVTLLTNPKWREFPVGDEQTRRQELLTEIETQLNAREDSA